MLGSIAPACSNPEGCSGVLPPPPPQIWQQAVSAQGQGHLVPLGLLCGDCWFRSAQGPRALNTPVEVPGVERGHVASLGPCQGRNPRAGDRERLALFLWDQPHCLVYQGIFLDHCLGAPKKYLSTPRLQR